MATGPDLRIGDADREAAAARLREHYAAGRLTFEEFNQRLDAAFAATTQSQLAQVTRDLPHVGVPAGALPAATAGPRRERSRQHYGSALPRGLRLLPVIIAMFACWLLLFDLPLRFFWPGRLVIFLAIFAAVRSLMRSIFRQARGGQGGYPRGRRRGPWF